MLEHRMMPTAVRLTNSRTLEGIAVPYNSLSVTLRDRPRPYKERIEPRSMQWDDNVVMLIDGLPTMNSPTAERGMVSGQERLKYFLEAEREIPRGVPVNVLLYPMEGDYQASIAYWVLAWGTGGAFMSISKDWP